MCFWKKRAFPFTSFLLFPQRAMGHPHETYSSSQKWVHSSHFFKIFYYIFSLRGVLTLVASGLDINGCVLSYFEGTANLHCYTSCTLTTLHCSKVSFLQCCHMKRYNKIFTKMWGVCSLLWDTVTDVSDTNKTSPHICTKLQSTMPHFMIVRQISTSIKKKRTKNVISQSHTAFPWNKHTDRWRTWCNQGHNVCLGEKEKLV